MDSKLAMAKKMGASHVINTTGLSDPKEIAKRVHEAIGGPADITIECTGVEQSVRAAVAVCVLCVCVGVCVGV